MAREPFVEKLTNKWIGAAFFWAIHFFKGRYTDYLDPKFDKKNTVTGYIINLIILGLIIFFLVSPHWRK